ncbi:diguanylate cyclase (GGDEF) domain-containing protein [Marinobacter daqiaonensis]|uniref:diguanylate cyclase n=1 Tax=Marinobacter daqiaonensis TaxID=650891 RepID=A0A1I6I3B0_9GAMM|nr:GGDEF domain-containing protein [Marinobacter daqiaonensis]SFR61205.1 diguanylate cyclase (GGDEF) domain-containing protein [Marinobacter daqiaonensis]
MGFHRWRLKNRIFAGFLVIGLIGVGVALSMGLAISNIYSDFRRFTVFSERAELGQDLSTRMIDLQRLSEEFIQEGESFSADQANLVFEQARGLLARLGGSGSEPVMKRAAVIATHLDSFQQAFSEVKIQRNRQSRLITETIQARAEEYGALLDQFAARIPPSGPESVALVERLRTLALQVERLTHRYFDSLDNSLIREVRSNVRLSRELIRQLRDLHQSRVSLRLLGQMEESVRAYEEVILEAVQRTRGYLFLVNVVMAAETHEILYQSDRLSDELHLEMNRIESDVARTIRQAFLLGLSGSAVMLVLIIGLSYAIGRSIATPIENLAGTFRRLAKGETVSGLRQREAGYELHELSKAAEVFRERNQETERLLIRYREISEELEERVKERTEELEGANRKLQQLSRTDSLTGLANRRHFEEILDREWSTALRSGLSLSVIMLDIDYFKAFNDRYGHPAGDQCLRDVAISLQRHLRRGDDLAARYGGEEFIVILQDAGHDKAMDIAESLCRAVSGLDIPHQDSPWQRITISVGVAVLEPASDITSAFELVKNADSALYRAKMAGRNRVVMFSNPPTAPPEPA